MLSQHLITQKINGIRAGHTIRPRDNQLDLNNSMIMGADLSTSDSTEDKDDKIVIGYTSQGLPYQVVVKGNQSAGCDNAALFRFIDLHVISLINQFASILTVTRAEEEQVRNKIKAFIIKVNEMHEEHAPNVNFSMGLAIVFKKEQQLFCAGFGVGGVGFLLYDGVKVSALCDTVALSNKQNIFVTQVEVGSSDHDNGNEGNKIAEQASVFFQQVRRGQEIVGYTNLYLHKFDKAKGRFVEFLNRKICEEMKTLQGAKINMAYLLGSMIIPEGALQVKLQHEYQLRQKQRPVAHIPQEFLQTLEAKRKKKESSLVWHNKGKNYFEHDWQLYISIKPTQENLYRAARVLSSVLCTTDISFTCAYFAEDSAIKNWDVTSLSSPDRGISDRDRRGKEVCILIRYNRETGNYEKNAIELKELLLKCWKVLNAAGVETGYTNNPFGTREILIDGGELPSIFSYACPPTTKYYDALSNNDYNHNQYEDPLEFLEISLQDLENAGIDIRQVERIQIERLTYLKKHRKKAKEHIQKLLQDIKEGSIINERIENIKQRFKNVGIKPHYQYYEAEKKVLTDFEQLFLDLEHLLLEVKQDIAIDNKLDRYNHIADIIIELFVRFPRLPNANLQRNVVINTWMSFVEELDRNPNDKLLFLNSLTKTAPELIKQSCRIAEENGVGTAFNHRLSMVEAMLQQTDNRERLVLIKMYNRELLVLIEMLKMEVKQETKTVVDSLIKHQKYLKESFAIDLSPVLTLNKKTEHRSPKGKGKILTNEMEGRGSGSKEGFLEELKKSASLSAKRNGKKKEKRVEDTNSSRVSSSDSEQLHNWIENSLPDMQLFLRLLKHYQHESRALKNEKIKWKARCKKIIKHISGRENELYVYLRNGRQKERFSFDDYRKESIVCALSQFNAYAKEKPALSTEESERLTALKTHHENRLTVKTLFWGNLMEIIEIFHSQLLAYLSNRQQMKNSGFFLFKSFTQEQISYIDEGLETDLKDLLQKLRFHVKTRTTKSDYVLERADELQAILQLAIEQNKRDMGWFAKLSTSSARDSGFGSCLTNIEYRLSDWCSLVKGGEQLLNVPTPK